MLAVFHYLFLELHLYWLYLWLDIPVHFLGGVTVALGFLTFLGFFPKLVDKHFTLFRTLAFVLLVALAWEIFEVYIGIPFEEGNYLGDTVLDLIMGMSGGLAGYSVGRRVSQLDYE